MVWKQKSLTALNPNLCCNREASCPALNPTPVCCLWSSPRGCLSPLPWDKLQLSWCACLNLSCCLAGASLSLLRQPELGPHSPGWGFQWGLIAASKLQSPPWAILPVGISSHSIPSHLLPPTQKSPWTQPMQEQLTKHWCNHVNASAERHFHDTTHMDVGALGCLATVRQERPYRETQWKDIKKALLLKSSKLHFPALFLVCVV